MNSYDFKSLSSLEFELLTQDLLQKEWGITLEGFKQGKDGGIDLRYAKDNKNEIIVQCKHYADSTFSKLFSDLKNELEKVIKINPERYLIVTSQKLSPDNKKKLQELFKNYIKNQSDIIGYEDLNAKLRENDDIETKHYKLWMTSTNILLKIFNNKIHSQTYFKLEEIKDKIKLFVSNPSVPKAKRSLEENNYVIICGNPGVGKTILAEMLIWENLSNGYEFVNISKDINEGFELFNHDPNVKQIFYFDDFLGTTCLVDMLNKNEDSRLILFIEHIYKSKNKKLILTTREYILRNAQLNYEKLAEFNYEKCIIDLKEYTDKIKGKILYNHLFFSELSKDYIDTIVKDETYLKIINHENYNPRIIEYMTLKNREKDVLPSEYIELFIENLDNPEKVWKHAFEYQLPNNAKAILIALVGQYDNSFLGGATIRHLETLAIKASLHFYSEKMNYNDYKKGLKLLDGDFIKINEEEIKFSNPSVRDYLENHILENNLITSYINFASSIKQFDWLYKRYVRGLNNESLYNELLKKITDKGYYSNLSAWEFKHNLKMISNIICWSKNVKAIEVLIDILEFDLTAKKSVEAYDIVSENLEKDFYITSQKINEFLRNCKNSILSICESTYSLDEFNSLGLFVSAFEECFTAIELEKIKDHVYGNIDTIVDELIDDTVSEDELEELRDLVENIGSNLDLSISTYGIDNKIDEMREEAAENLDYQADQYREAFSYDNEEPIFVLQKIPQKDEIKDMFEAL